MQFLVRTPYFYNGAFDDALWWTAATELITGDNPLTSVFYEPRGGSTVCKFFYFHRLLVLTATFFSLLQPDLVDRITKTMQNQKIGCFLFAFPQDLDELVLMVNQFTAAGLVEVEVLHYHFDGYPVKDKVKKKHVVCTSYIKQHQSFHSKRLSAYPRFISFFRFIQPERPLAYLRFSSYFLCNPSERATTHLRFV